MSDIVIKAAGLSKAYTITHQHRQGTATLRETITHGIKNVLTRRGDPQQAPGCDSTEQFWALRDASFEVRRGDRVGIIGRNGAGKSTLLKILSRITTPTAGRVEITGRVASLLEVGTGFHAELTGRENIFLNGAILGMSRAEIKKKFDEIVAFAEVEQFLDTPVKRYSSGMYVRLAFAVAAHLESEILLVDEVLAVGDAAFQKKCLGKMQDVSTQEDRTILFVSHNMTAIQSLCSSGLLLKDGCIQTAGTISGVINEYFSSEFRCRLTSAWERGAAPGNDAIRIKKVAVIPESDDPVLDVTTPFEIVSEFWICQDSVNVTCVAMALKNIKGEYIFAPCTTCDLNRGLHRAAVHIPGNLLNDDTYTVEFYFIKDKTVFFVHQDCAVFQVNDIPRLSTGYLGKWVGAVRPTLRWECTSLADA